MINSIKMQHKHLLIFSQFKQKRIQNLFEGNQHKLKGMEIKNLMFVLLNSQYQLSRVQQMREDMQEL